MKFNKKIITAATAMCFAPAVFSQATTTITIDYSADADVSLETSAGPVFSGTAKVPVAVSTNGHDMSLTASNTGVMGVIYNTTISGKGNLRLESKTNSGLGTGTNKIIGLDSVTVNFQRFPTLDAKKLVNAPKMSAHHRGICHF